MNDGGVALGLDGLTKVFGHRKALDRVSLELPEGAFLSIFGHNGAGKSTLLRVITTLLPFSSGKATVLGYDLREQPDMIRANIGVVSHQSLLYADLTAEENLRFFAGMYGVEDPRSRVLDLLRTVGLDHRRLDQVKTFSRGMTQRLSIARAMLADPRMLVLDEPYSGLDPHAVEVLDSLIERVRGDRTVVMVSHDLEKGLAMCTHALMLSHGRSVYFGQRDSIIPDEFTALYRDSVGVGTA